MDSIYSINIERAVLSAILFDYELMEDAKTVLKAQDFYLPAHKVVYDVMMKLYDAGLPIDEEFIRKRCNPKEVDDSIFIELLSANPITNVSAYLKEIKDGSIKRELCTLATTIKKATLEEGMSADDALIKVGQEYDRICDDGSSNDLKTMAQEVLEFEESFSNIQDKPTGFPTGFSALDRAGVIYEPGDLVIIAARPSIGKTSLVETMIEEYVNKHNIGVLFDSLEMPTQKIIRDLIAVFNEESKSDLKRGVVKDIKKYKETLYKLKTTPNLIIHDKSYVPIEYLRAKARKIFRKNPHIKIWFIDHFKYISSTGRDRAYEVGVMTKILKSVAKEFGIVVVALSQMTRPKEKATSYRPTIQDLRESGSLEEDADIILLPHREDYYKRSEKNYYEKPITDGEIIIGKYRSGESKIVRTQFNAPIGKWGVFPIVEYEKSYTSAGDNDGVEVPIQM